jgi:hypothetical protein
MCPRFRVKHQGFWVESLSFRVKMRGSGVRSLRFRVTGSVGVGASDAEAVRTSLFVCLAHAAAT